MIATMTAIGLAWNETALHGVGSVEKALDIKIGMLGNPTTAQKSVSGSPQPTSVGTTKIAFRITMGLPAKKDDGVGE